MVLPQDPSTHLLQFVLEAVDVVLVRHVLVWLARAASHDRDALARAGKVAVDLTLRQGIVLQGNALSSF